MYGTEFVTQSDAVKEKIKESIEKDSSKDFRIGSKNFSKNIKEKYSVNNISSLDELFRIKGTSLHFAGADRLLKNFPEYEPVGMECKCEDQFHEKGSCLPNNEQIVLSYGFLPVYDCGYKKWLLKIS